MASRAQQAKQLLNNAVLDGIFADQFSEIVERFKQASADDVPTLVACNIETRALERLKDCINEKCQAIVDEFGGNGDGNA